MEPKEIIGSYSAKTRLAAILDRVDKEKKEYVITKHGRPVAIISPYLIEEHKDIKGSIAQFIEYRNRRNITLETEIKTLKQHRF